MRNINCQYIDQVSFCENKNIKRSLFGFGKRHCIEYETNKACKFILPWPKPLIPQHPPSPKGKGLILPCDICKKVMKNPGALLFSPPKGNVVKKYHICKKCFEENRLILLPHSNYKAKEVAYNGVKYSDYKAVIKIVTADHEPVVESITFSADIITSIMKIGGVLKAFKPGNILTIEAAPNIVKKE